MKSLITLVVLGYLTVCLLLFFFQRSFLYFPQATGHASATTASFDNNGQLLNGWVLNPGQRHLLLYYGGNASAIENNIEFFNLVAPQHTVYLIPYRGYGGNKGRPTEAGLYADALYIYDHLVENYDSVTAMGRSLGSGVATFVAANRKVDKLVLSTPFDSIENVAKAHYPLLPVSLLLKDKYQSADRVDTISATTLILIAENDQIIARERSEALADQFDSRRLTKIVVAGAGHNDISMYPDYMVGVQAFLESQ